MGETDYNALANEITDGHFVPAGWSWWWSLPKIELQVAPFLVSSSTISMIAETATVYRIGAINQKSSYRLTVKYDYVSGGH